MQYKLYPYADGVLNHGAFEMELQIVISPEIMSIDKLKDNLEAQNYERGVELILETRKSETRLRGMDPTILVAIAGAGGAAIGALITGLLQILKQTIANKIVMQTRSGYRLEIPANLSPEEIEALIEKLRKLDTQGIKMAIL